MLFLDADLNPASEEEDDEDSDAEPHDENVEGDVEVEESEGESELLEPVVQTPKIVKCVFFSVSVPTLYSYVTSTYSAKKNAKGKGTKGKGKKSTCKADHFTLDGIGTYLFAL